MSNTFDTQKDGFTFIWKIRNFSFLPKLNVEIVSPVFTADNLNKACFYLRLFPVGCYQDMKDIGFQLHQIEQRDIWLDYELSILYNGDLKAKSVAIRGTVKVEKSSSSPVFCLTPDEIFRRREILPRDTLTVQCKMWYYRGKCSEPGFSLACTRIGVDRKSFIWTIDNFSTLGVNIRKYMDVKLRSDLKLSFILTLYLIGARTEENIHIKVEGNNEETSIFIVGLEISVPDINGKTVYHSADEFKLSKGKAEWRFPLILDKKEIESNKNLLLPGDRLSMKCLFNFSKGDKVLNVLECTTYGANAASDQEAALTDTIESPCVCKEEHSRSSSLRNDLKHLFEDKQYADVNLQIQNETFPVHKAILAARSLVFKTMLDTNMKEKFTNNIEIDDIAQDTMRRFLLYIYTDTLEDIQWENASSLYLAAEKYAVLGLKERCSSFLKMNLSVRNVCEILVMADMLKDEELKNSAQDFIQSNNTIIMNSNEWENFAKKHPQLTIEVLTHLFKNK